MEQNFIIPNEKEAMLKTLRNMNVGDTAVFPLESRPTIRTYCCEFGLEWRRKYKSRTDRVSRTVMVIREK